VFDYIDQGFYWLGQAYAETPWARAGLVVAAVVALLLAVPMAKLLRSNPVIVGLLLGAFGAVLVLTLTPRLRVYGAPETCYLQFGKPTRADLIQPTDVSLNLLLLFPVGVLLTWLRPLIAVCCAFLIALALPVAVEYAQYSLTQLGRNCSFYDIETNVIGLLAGVAVGLVVRLVWTVMAGLVRMVKR
jgi:hypothetical protein